MLSDFMAVTSDVPQGSVLGPVLFIFYISDITKSATPSMIKLYADDLKAYCTDKNDKEGANFKSAWKIYQAGQTPGN